MVTDCDTWPVPLIDLSEPTDLCVNGCTIPADTDPDVLDAASVQAGVILYTLSGHQVGTCLETIRPLSECGVCRGHCRCGSGDRLRLFSWSGPISEVTEVTVDGTPLEDEDWRYYPSGQLLYRVPPDVWPTRDDRTVDCDAVGSMCVEVVIGNSPDAWALAVHAELVCELIKSCTGVACRLPSNATNVTGQGVTITLSPDDAHKFIPSVANWVAAVNPDNAQTVSQVFSPDLYRPWG